MYSSQTPIDIHCSKLVDWLVQRRHCKKDWGENLAPIRRKIRAALLDMPENEEIKQLLIGSKLDYFKSKQIVELLKTTEASSKNIFGFYSSQRMKDWQDIVYSYEKDNIYLAEIATDLIRETNYEVPGIRKVVSRLNREKEELEKERANLLRKVQQFNSEYQRLAQSYGIKGEDVGREIEEQSKVLTLVMEEIVILSKDLKESLQYYREYASATSKQDASRFILMLHYIIEKGNTTVYEWKHGEAPERLVAEEPACTGNPSEIDLGDDEIDFGEDSPSSESSSGFVHVNKLDGDNVDSEVPFVNVDAQSQTTQDKNEKVAFGDDARLVLEFRRSRNQFLNNLYELEAFFVQLSNDIAAADDRSSSFLTEGSSRARRYDISEINEVITKIRQIMSIMNSEKNMLLFQMNDSPIFLENIKEKFASKLKQAADCSTKADLLCEKVKEVERQKKETEIHLKQCIVAANELQGKVETSLSCLYNGRSINIMGCVG